MFGADFELRAAVLEAGNPVRESLGLSLRRHWNLSRLDRGRDFPSPRFCKEACIVRLEDAVSNYSRRRCGWDRKYCSESKERVQRYSKCMILSVVIMETFIFLPYRLYFLFLSLNKVLRRGSQCYVVGGEK